MTTQENGGEKWDDFYTGSTARQLSVVVRSSPPATSMQIFYHTNNDNVTFGPNNLILRGVGMVVVYGQLHSAG